MTVHAAVVFNANTGVVQFEAHGVEIRITHMDVHIKIIFVYIAGRIIADFFPFCVCSGDFCTVFIDIQITACYIRKSHYIGVFFCIVAGGCYHENTCIFIQHDLCAFPQNAGGAEGCYFFFVRFAVFQLFCDLIYCGMASVIEPGRQFLCTFLTEVAVFQFSVA